MAINNTPKSHNPSAIVIKFRSRRDWGQYFNHKKNIITIFVFFWNLKEDGDVAYAIGFTIGYVYLFTVPSTFFAVFIMN